ncbi:glycosyltransferase [Candidatus Falkowbacteria bacterium]|nr:glycosyltransferase [Candidatus Falkowbacteria bacterium]
MDISVIIVNYKNPEKTNACIESIKNSDTGDLNLEIIAVDNNSRDDSIEKISRAHPDIKIIASNKNLGMGGGNNIGIAEAGGRYLLILNPDTIIKGEAIKKLHDLINSREDVGIVGPRLLNPDNSLQYSCLRFPKFHTPFFRRTFLGKLAPGHLNRFLMKDFDHSETREVDWMIGSCLMIDRNLLAKLSKAFDEKFFMYFEDTDLCRRCWKESYKVVYHPQAVVVHDHMRQSAGKPWYLAPFTDKLAREHIKSWMKYFIS